MTRVSEVTSSVGLPDQTPWGAPGLWPCGTPPGLVSLPQSPHLVFYI